VSNSSADSKVKPVRAMPPSALPGISPTRVEIGWRHGLRSDAKPYYQGLQTVPEKENRPEMAFRGDWMVIDSEFGSGHALLR
jgi:hypothetical protein